jgi:L-asparaginase
MQYDDRVRGSGATNSRENGFGSFSTEIPQRRAEYEAKLKSLGTGTVAA